MKKDTSSAQLSWGLAASTLVFATLLAVALACLDLWRADRDDDLAVARQLEQIRIHYPLLESLDRLDRLKVSMDRAALREKTLSRFGSHLVSELILTLCVSAFVMLLIERRVMRYLRQASRFVMRRNSENLSEVLRFERRKFLRRDDELDHLLRGLAGMQAELTQAFANLQHDIERRKLLENQLQKLSLAVEQSPVSIVITNTSAEIEYVNQTFLANTGYSAQEVIGKNPSMLKSGKTPAQTYDALWEALMRGETWKGELYNRRKDGSEIVDLAVISPIFQPDGMVSHYVSVQDDITARKAASERIHTLAYYDQLTGLPNRRLLIEQLQRAVQSSADGEQSAALLYIDLDNFKTLNETLGHDMGDALLQQVARRLRACVRSGDTVARIGGDEFVLLVHDLGDMPIKVASRVQVLGDKVLASLNRNYQLGDHVHHSTPSIGVALIGQGSYTVDDILRHADLAMYEAKAAGRNTLRFFDPKMQAEVAMRAALEEDLRRALVLGQFQLHYQAQVQGDGKITGAEVLLRWQHRERGMVSPAQFISVAEETGLILPLGQWVLDTACEQLALWSAKPGLERLSIAVNVSSRQFQDPGFVEAVLSTLARTEANPRRLKLELTESLLVQDVEDVIAKMTALKAHGIGFSLDDFGTGYSSLSYLKRLPLDQLKIDQGFVRDILNDPNDAAIAKMVMALAESLGLAVIAEGVETQAQRDYLASLDCHAYQGYLFARPLPLPEFEALVQVLGVH